MKVGFIGLGTMGGNAAKNILRAGFQTVVHDLRPEAARDHIALGAAWADSPKAVIDQVDCVISMVFGPPQCEAVLKAAITACERYYQSFQFVMWAGKTAREALESAMFETVGQA